MNGASLNLLHHAGYVGSVEVSVKDGCLHGRLLHVDALVTYEGDTVAQIQSNFEAAIDRYLQHCKSIRKAPDRPYTGSFNVRLGPDRHRWLVQTAAARSTTINDLIGIAVDLFRQQPSDASPATVTASYSIVSGAPGAEFQLLQRQTSGTSEGVPRAQTSAPPSVTILH